MPAVVPRRIPSVNYTLGGTASSSSDYSGSTAGTLNFASNQVSQTVMVNVIGDTTFEANETISLTLSGGTAPSGGIVSYLTATVVATITNDDAMPTLTIADSTALENNGPLVFTITLSAASDFPITVTYQTVNGTATTADNDYTTIGATQLVIPAGSLSQTINVAITGDTKYELDETMLISLTNATMANSQAVGTIQNDDTAPTIAMRLQTEPTADVKIGLSSSNVNEGIVISPTNLYTITFTPSNWSISQTVTITGIDDFVDDGDQAFTIASNVESSDTDYNNMTVADVR